MFTETQNEMVEQTTNNNHLSIREKIQKVFGNIYQVELPAANGGYYKAFRRLETPLQALQKNPENMIHSIKPVKYYHCGAFESDMFTVVSFAATMHEDITVTEDLEDYFLNGKEEDQERISEKLLHLLNNLELAEKLLKEIKKGVWLNYDLMYWLEAEKSGREQNTIEFFTKFGQIKRETDSLEAMSKRLLKKNVPVNSEYKKSNLEFTNKVTELRRDCDLLKKDCGTINGQNFCSGQLLSLAKRITNIVQRVITFNEKEIQLATGKKSVKK